MSNVHMKTLEAVVVWYRIIFIRERSIVFDLSLVHFADFDVLVK